MLVQGDGVMDLVAPQGPVYQAGTLSGNPVAMAAGVAALSTQATVSRRMADRVAAVPAVSLVDVDVDDEDAGHPALRPEHA